MSLKQKTRKKKVMTARHSSSSLIKQIDAYIDSLETYNKKLPNRRDTKNYRFLRHFFRDFIQDQNGRAQEVSSYEYETVKALANKQFAVKPYWKLCIDGRVLPVLINGASAGVGASIRVPGGILREFVRGKDGKLKLKEDSDFAVLVKKALVDAKEDVIAEIFDSHVGCAARLAEEQMKGRSPSDSGLYADVSHKKQMAEATVAYVEKVFGKKKRIMPILTSFNPHTGYMYMGLETEKAFAFAEKNGRNFSSEIIQDLIEKDVIISTQHLVAYPHIRKAFKKHVFSLDWRGRYTESAKKFWMAIDAMKNAGMHEIEKRLLRVYPHLGKSDLLSRLELEERATLLLTNAFSGFLHSKVSKKQQFEEEDEGSLLHYPYGVHEEECVKVSEGGFSPYKISAFVVFSFEEKNLPESISLSASLVRKNRKEGRIVDRSSFFSNPQEFSEAIIPVIVQEIVRDDLARQEWYRLSSISWDDMPENWDTMTDTQFLEYLHLKTSMPFGVAVGINNIRRHMAVLYDPYNTLSSRLIEQYKVALPVIANRNRSICFIVPFVKLGYS